MAVLKQPAGTGYIQNAESGEANMQNHLTGKRDSNRELLRIIAIILITFDHIASLGQATGSSLPFNHYLALFYSMWCISDRSALCCAGIAPPEATSSKSSAEFREKARENPVQFTDWTNRTAERFQTFCPKKIGGHMP